MSELTFRTQGSTVKLVCGGNEKTLEKDVLLEVCQTILSRGKRDYSEVTSVKKLLRLIELECEPDESGEDSENEAEPVVAKKPVAKPTTVRRPVAGKKTVNRQPVTKPPQNGDSDSSE
jgi:hypothetical protein